MDTARLTHFSVDPEILKKLVSIFEKVSNESKRPLTNEHYKEILMTTTNLCSKKVFPFMQNEFEMKLNQELAEKVFIAAALNTFFVLLAVTDKAQLQ